MFETSASRQVLTPEVTVVIPAYNRAATIGRAIESVLAQTSQDFEIIVVDDASTDGTIAAVASFPDGRIRLIRHEQNRGGSAARNTGFRAGSAAYVAFLDSDDEWLPTKLERQLEAFKRSDGHLALVYTGADRVAADGTITRHIPPPPVNLARALLTKNVIGETSLGMVRRSALDAIGGFDETLPSCQDLDLWLRICERFRAHVIPEPLVRAAKGNSDRISLDGRSTVMGRQRYCDKHRQKMIRQQVLHVFLRETGWWYQREARNARQARRCYRESLAARPLAPLTYVLFLISWVPLSWVDRFAGWKHRVTASSVSGGQETFSSWNPPAASNDAQGQLR